MSDVEKAIDAAFSGLEAGRRRIAHERVTAANALANLYERLGVEDEDVVAVDQVLSDWHSMLVKMADDFSAGVRLLSEID